MSVTLARAGEQPADGRPFSVPTVFEEPEDPSNRSFFSEIISSVSDVKFSRSGRYMLTRDYLTVKVWDLNMEARPLETYQVGAAAPPCSVGWETPGLLSLCPQSPRRGRPRPQRWLSYARVGGEDTQAQEIRQPVPSPQLGREQKHLLSPASRGQWVLSARWPL